MLDIVMPVMDGFEFMKRKNAISEYQNIPVIVVTGSNESESEEKALLMGADDFVVLPYKKNIILKRLENIIGLKETIANLENAEKDLLTGLINRRAFCTRVKKKIDENNIRYQILAIEVEDFRRINGAYGWEEGDNCLRILASCIRDEFGGQDSILAHGDADKFFVFRKKCDDLTEKYESIQTLILDRYKKAKIKINFGVYNIDDIHINVSDMCDYVLLAIDNAKSNKETKIIYYDESFRNKIIREQMITNIADDSLNENQFKVYLQPKYDIATNTIMGAEALVRWIHPTLGFMSPGEFIPIFEKNGFITKLDIYIWERVCYLLGRWKKIFGKCLPVSVNVSRIDVYRKDLPNIFLDMIERYGVEPQSLHIEITETAYMENAERLVETVTKLKEHGFVIEMDDFGSGYSSLATLNEIPFDIIKIDMKFIQSNTIFTNSHNILGTIINLAKWMNALVICEGVETEKQLEYLRKLNCNFVQGYYYCKPIPEDEFEQKLMNDGFNPIYDMDAYLANVASRVKASEGEEAQKPLILIVDDLELNRAVIKEFIQDKYRVVEAPNGQVAWECIVSQRGDVSAVISDIYMPVMGGFDLLDKIRESEEYGNLPVIITSSQAESDNRDLLKVHGADEFIMKPYEREEIIQKLVMVMNK
ncbi:MAG: EAL domain-containing protein [Coprococcus sp.]|nr:EAL domain-containing protein [Coprococcus sp.]